MVLKVPSERIFWPYRPAYCSYILRWEIMSNIHNVFLFILSKIFCNTLHPSLQILASLHILPTSIFGKPEVTKRNQTGHLKSVSQTSVLSIGSCRVALWSTKSASAGSFKESLFPLVLRVTSFHRRILKFRTSKSKETSQLEKLLLGTWELSSWKFGKPS